MRRSSRRGLVALTLSLSSFLLACADKPPAPIEDHTRPGSVRSDERYTVLRGDTLYSIAFRYGLDSRRLAAANGIGSPYIIFPGQTLRLAEADPPPRPASSRASSTPASPTTASSTPARGNPSASSSAGAAASKPVTSTAAKTSVSRAPEGSTTADSAAGKAEAKVSRWRWPAQGRVTRRFDSTLHKGIDIGGDRGDPVNATAGGRVVYAGSGIAGYGLMLILRHNDEYLSAYGHNDALLVSEGDVVRAGQLVARRGSSGTDSVKLHFEIRRRGRPVDPSGLLPSR